MEFGSLDASLSFDQQLAAFAHDANQRDSFSPYEASDDGSQRRAAKVARQARGACRRCKKLKMKCEYTDESGPCTRCRTNEHSCEVEPRRHTSQKNARSALLRQVQKKDALIASLLQHLYTTMAVGEPQTPDSDGSMNLEADDEQEAQASGSRAKQEPQPENLPSASPGAPQHHAAPSMTPEAFAQACMNLEFVQSTAIRVEEIDGLFHTFFSRMNAQINLLDPALHSPRQLLQRCPFLFTTVCAITAKHLPRPGAYAQAMACARKAAAEALISNRKTVEMCQAYILLGQEFTPLAPSWEEDRSSLFQGLALRLALDLNLGGRSAALPVVERRNRERTWICCAWLDWIGAMQSGRAISFPDDSVLRRIGSWYTEQGALPGDVHLCAAVELLRVVRRFADLFTNGDSDSGVNGDAMIRVFDEAVSSVIDDWNQRIERVRNPDPLSKARSHALNFLYHYCKLRMLSMIIERCTVTNEQPTESCYLKCWHTGLAALTEVVDHIAPSGFLQYAPDPFLKFSALSAAFTLRLLAPRFSPMISPDSRLVATDLIDRLIAVFEVDSPQGVMAPQVYAQALRGLMLQYAREGGTGSFGALTPTSEAGLSVTMERRLFEALDSSAVVSFA
ncbi:hypothetical protein AURDEDRAFT_114485 [Auricularia subglabra TFB-10046 SS5]|nr:hypothetical protein AURDEDRAFT_114485 [Auricularia subglabra TFB-10046 SS5]